MKTKWINIFLAGVITFGLATAQAASNGHQDSTPQQVFDGMRRSFQVDKAKGVNARYQFNLSGPNGGTWFVDVNDGKLQMDRGTIDHPNVTLATTDRDWVALSN